MPQTIKNEAGEEVEVFTKEELDAAAEQKAKEVEEALDAERKQEREAMDAEKKELEEELEKLKEKDLNFSKFRQQQDKKNNKNSDGETQEDIQKQIEELNKKIEGMGEQAKQDVLTDFIKDKIGEDKDKKEKFDYYYNRLGKDAKTKEEIVRAAKEALTLATGGEYNGENDMSIHSVGANQNYRNQNTGERSETAKAMGERLGVSEADAKKYGKKNK